MFGYKSLIKWSNHSVKSYNRDCHFHQGEPLRYSIYDILYNLYLVLDSFGKIRKSLYQPYILS